MQPHPMWLPNPGLDQKLHPLVRAAVSALTTAGTIASGRTVAFSSTDLATSQHAWLVTWTAAELAAWTE